MRLLTVMASAALFATTATAFADTPSAAGAAPVSVAAATKGIKLTQNDIRNFLMALSPDARSALLSQCAGYLAAPGNGSAADREFAFCTIAGRPLPPP